jgi:hypothetical protein
MLKIDSITSHLPVPLPKVPRLSMYTCTLWVSAPTVRPGQEVFPHELRSQTSVLVVT